MAIISYDYDVIRGKKSENNREIKETRNKEKLAVSSLLLRTLHSVQWKTFRLLNVRPIPLCPLPAVPSRRCETGPCLRLPFSYLFQQI